MINLRISADWSTTKPIAAFSCTPLVQEVHTKAEVVHLPFPRKCIAKHMINPRILGVGLLSLGVLFNCHT